MEARLAEISLRLCVVIVNYRTAHLVCDCLHSLCNSIDKSRDLVIVVDNNSEDNSVELLAQLIAAQGWGGWITLLPQKHNKGFAAGNNAAIRHALSIQKGFDYVMLLNPDTIVHVGAISHLIHLLDIQSTTGIVGAQLENSQHQLEISARRFPSVLSELDSGARLGVLSRVLKNWQVALPLQTSAHRCDWVSGAAMMIRRKVFDQIGLMDEGYFLYFEDLDFCRRAQEKGWEVWIEPRSLITHLEGAATGIQTCLIRRGKFWYDSRRRYLVKHLGIIQWLWADLFWVLGRCSLMFRKMLRLGGNTSGDPLYFMQDLLMSDVHALLTGEVFTTRKETRP